MTVIAVFKCRLVFQRSGKSFAIMARQANRDPVLQLQILAIAYMRSVAISALVLYFQGAMNNRLASLGLKITVTA